MLVGLASGLATTAATAVILLGVRRLGLDRPGPAGIATGAGLFAVGGLLTLIGRRATRRSRTGARGAGVK